MLTDHERDIWVGVFSTYVTQQWIVAAKDVGSTAAEKCLSSFVEHGKELADRTLVEYQRMRRKNTCAADAVSR